MRPRADGEPTVIVARTILPTELPLIAAAALVVETGGPLDHVAAQARERGIPAVVGAVGALDRFRGRRSRGRRRRRGGWSRESTERTTQRTSSTFFGLAVVGEVLEDHLVEALVADQLAGERLGLRRRGGSQGIRILPEVAVTGASAIGCAVRDRDRLRHPRRARASPRASGSRATRPAAATGPSADAGAVAGHEPAAVPDRVVRAGARARRRRRRRRGPPAGLIVPLTGGWPAPTLMTTLRRTTTPSAGLETCTGERLSTAGWTTTTGLGVIFGRAGAGAAASAGAGTRPESDRTGASAARPGASRNHRHRRRHLDEHRRRADSPASPARRAR